MNIYLVTTSCKPGADSFNRIYLFNIRLCCCTDSVAHMVLGLVTRTEQESCEICHKYQFGFLIMQCSHMIILQQLKLIFLGEAHGSSYRRSLALSSTTISYSVYVVILGVCLRFKPHWKFQIYKCVIKGREELTSCSSVATYQPSNLPSACTFAQSH